MVNKLVNLAVTTTSWAAEFVTMNNSAEARAFLEVGGGGGSAVSSVNGKVGAVNLVYSDIGAASAAQGAKADTALQPGDAPGAITSVNGKTGVVVLVPSDIGAATSAQGAKADSALQPGDVPGSPVQSVNGKQGTVVLVASDVGAATTAQGAKADSAVQPGDLAAVATTGSYNSLSGLPTLGTAAAQSSSAFATAAQGAKADTAVQPTGLAAVAVSGTYASLTSRPTHTSGLYSALPTGAAPESSTYYATDVRETYRYYGGAWNVLPNSGLLIASVSYKTPVVLTGHNISNPDAIPALGLTFVAGQRPVVIGFGATMQNGDSGSIAVMVLRVNGSKITQLYHSMPSASTFGTHYRRSPPLTFTPGSTVTVEILAAVNGTSNGQLFGNVEDPITVEVINV